MSADKVQRVQIRIDLQTAKSWIYLTVYLGETEAGEKRHETSKIVNVVNQKDSTRGVSVMCNNEYG